MKSIDGQIGEIRAKEIEKQSEDVKKQEESKLKTEEEIQNERLTSLTNLFVDIEQSQKISSVQARVEGNARVLKSEIKLDKQRAGSSPRSREMIAKMTDIQVQDNKLSENDGVVQNIIKIMLTMENFRSIYGVNTS